MSNLPKGLLSALVLRRAGLERYGGSAAGALAFLRGRTALAREGLTDDGADHRRAPSMRGRNGFTGLRLALALAVVVSHAFSVATGAAGDEPLARLTGYTLGEHAVNGFFAVSGFLVTMSCDRRGIRDYASPGPCGSCRGWWPRRSSCRWGSAPR